MVSSGGTIQRINDYIGRNWYGDKKYFAENEEIKELFSEYYADYVEELTTGLISNRPTPLLSYMRADAYNFDVNNKKRGYCSTLDKFLRGNSRIYSGMSRELVEQTLFRLKHPYWRYKIGTLVELNDAWDRAWENKVFSSVFNIPVATRETNKLRSGTPAMFLGIKTAFVCTKAFASYAIAHEDYRENFPVKRNSLASPSSNNFGKVYDDILYKRLVANKEADADCSWMVGSDSKGSLDTFMKSLELIFRTEEDVLRINKEDWNRLKNGLREKEPWEKDEKGGAIALATVKYTRKFNSAFSHLRKNASSKKKEEIIEEMRRRLQVDSLECNNDIKNLEKAIGLLATWADESDRLRTGHYRNLGERGSSSFKSLSYLRKRNESLDRIIGGIWSSTLCPTVLYTRVVPDNTWEHIPKGALGGSSEYKLDSDETLPRTHYDMGRIRYNEQSDSFAMMDNEKYEKEIERKGLFTITNHPMKNIRNYDGMVAFFQMWYQDGKVIYENVPSCFVKEMQENGDNGSGGEGRVSSLAMTPEERVKAGYPEKIWFQEVFKEYY